MIKKLNEFLNENLEYTIGKSDEFDIYSEDIERHIRKVIDDYVDQILNEIRKWERTEWQKQ